MPDVDINIAAFTTMQDELEGKQMGKWVLFHDQSLAGTFDSFEAAPEDAVRRFGRGPYLIRQVGAPPVKLPASLMYRPVNAF